jgi:hypothetical protein
MQLKAHYVMIVILESVTVCLVGRVTFVIAKLYVPITALVMELVNVMEHVHVILSGKEQLIAVALRQSEKMESLDNGLANMIAILEK